MSEHHCVYPNCDKKISARGLCRSHYMYALRLVLHGKTTWDLLEANGKCLPAKRKNNRTYKWFLRSTNNSNTPKTL